MINLLFTPQAEIDLEEIFNYTFNAWGIEQAERYQDELNYGFQLILKNNKIGQIYPFHNLDYRKLHINRHLIFYRIDKKSCLIVRILHDRMNPKKQFDQR